MGYKLIACSEGIIKSVDVSSSNLIVTEFGLVSSCMTFTILIDKKKVYVAHMVISPTGSQKTHTQLLKDIMKIVSDKTSSCEIIVAGALPAWQSDLSGPNTKWSKTAISTDSFENKLKITLKKLLPKADSISLETYSDCELYSATFIMDGKIVVQSFDASIFVNWKKYPIYAPGGWEAAVGAILGKQITEETDEKTDK